MQYLVCLSLYYVLATSNVKSGCILICESANSWWLYSAALQWDQATSTMTWYPDQSRYPDTEPTGSYPFLIMPSDWLGSDKYKSLSHWFDSTRVQTHKVWISWSPKTGDRCSTHSAILLGHAICNICDILYALVNYMYCIYIECII